VIIVVVNHSTLVTNGEVYDMTLAVNRQIRTDVAPAWGLLPPSVAYMAADPVIPGSAVLGIFDDADQAGDLGWHTEVAGGIVYGRIFAAPVLDNGGDVLSKPLSVASVLSHEVCETALDSACDLWADDGNGTAYARELCDAVESDSYMVMVGAGVSAIRCTVSNFLTPAWFDPNAVAGAEFDFMRLATAPFQVRPTGYTITMTEGVVNQTFGEHYPEWRKATKDYPIARTARRLKQGTPQLA
jgi:hypothetical protein